MFCSGKCFGYTAAIISINMWTREFNNHQIIKFGNTCIILPWRQAQRRCSVCMCALWRALIDWGHTELLSLRNCLRMACPHTWWFAIMFSTGILFAHRSVIANMNKLVPHAPARLCRKKINHYSPNWSRCIESWGSVLCSLYAKEHGQNTVHGAFRGCGMGSLSSPNACFHIPVSIIIHVSSTGSLHNISWKHPVRLRRMPFI